MAGHTWYWIAKVIDTPDSDVRQVTIEVFISEKKKNAITDLIGYIGRINEKNK